MTQIRLKDWSDLSEPGRAEAFGLCLGVAERIQTSLAPFVDLCRADARPADGPLRGLPYAAKDMFRSPGRNPTWGLAEPVDGLPDGEKADVLDRLDSAGACCIGFTRMTALAYQPSGVNPLQGAARNPWNPAFATGGSSSGSAVAVASGAAFVALGSDTGGSLRVPAQGCGVSAWKPTRGTVPDGGAMPLSPSLDTIGLLARSVRDIIAAAPVLAHGLPPLRDAGPPQRIAVMADALAASEPSVRAACRQALDAFAALGATLEPRQGISLVEAAGAETLTVMQAEAASVHRARLDDPILDPMLARRLRKGLGIDAKSLADSLARRAPMLDAFRKLLGGAEMLALPVMPIRTPPLAETDPEMPSFAPRTLYAMTAFTRFVNFLGLPAVALPAGFDDRAMPVALQLVGPPGSDMSLLSAAAALQSITDWHGRLPAGLAPLAPHYGDLLT